MPPRHRARLKDVAALSGVAESTASKVLNGVSVLSVRPETRARVLAAAEQLEYRPHAAARLLAGAPSRVIALLVPELTNPSYATIIRGAYLGAEALGYTVLLAEDSDVQQVDESFSDLVQAGRVDGLLIASARPSHRLISWLDGHWVPHVFVNRSVPGAPCNVVMEFGQSSIAAVDHLAKLGHRHVAHIGGPTGIETAEARAVAFLGALRSAGLPPGPVVRVGFEESGGASGMEQILRADNCVTAVYTSSLSQAVGALHVCHEHKLSVPSDYSIIANDDLPLADYLTPPLTTVAMPLFELGRAAAQALVEQLAGTPAHDVVVDTRARLVVRSSTTEAKSVEPTCWPATGCPPGQRSAVR